jgi:hypothetical protein
MEGSDLQLYSRRKSPMQVEWAPESVRISGNDKCRNEENFLIMTYDFLSK